MKKYIGLALFLVAQVGYAAQPHSLGSVSVSKLGFSQGTIASINALTSDTTGQVVFCSDCVTVNNSKGVLCMSTGTVSPGAWILLSTTTAVSQCK